MIKRPGRVIASSTVDETRLVCDRLPCRVPSDNKNTGRASGTRRWRRIAGHSRCLIKPVRLSGKEAVYGQDGEATEGTRGEAHVQ